MASAAGDARRVARHRGARGGGLWLEMGDMSATAPPRNHAVREGLLCGIGIPEQTGEMFPKVVPVTDPVPLRISSARPEATERLKAETGLDEARLTALVHRFYARAQADPLLGPVFAAASATGTTTWGGWWTSGPRSR